MTFRDKLQEYFSLNRLGNSIRSFTAFVIMLQSIQYNYTKDFAYKICGYSPAKFRKLQFSILTNQIDTRIPKSYSLRKTSGIILFFMMLDLDIKISKEIVERVSSFLSESQFKIFKILCSAYFELVKTGNLSKVLSSGEAERNLHFLDKLRQLEERRQKVIVKKGKIKHKKTKDTIYSHIGTFKPYYSHTNNIWQDIIPHCIKSIPMGGMNKIY